MTREELFKKYGINESHSEWNNNIDNWISVEIYRIMHDGKLPEGDNTSIWVCKFLDKLDSDTDNDWAKGSTGWTIQKNPDGYYHNFFTVTRLESFPAHSMVVWLKPNKGSSEFWKNYFSINDAVLVYDPDLDRDSLFVVIGPIDLVVSPLAGEEIRLALMPISQDQYPISIRPGNMVIRAYNLKFIKHKT